MSRKSINMAGKKRKSSAKAEVEEKDSKVAKTLKKGSPRIPASVTSCENVISQKNTNPLPDTAPSSGGVGGSIEQTPDVPKSSVLIVEKLGSTVIKIEKGDLLAHHCGRPTPEECLYVTMELAKLHPDVVDRNDERRKETLGLCGGRETVADGVVNTILSQNTTSANSTRAFANLKKAFPTWEHLLKEDTPTRLEEAIRCGGLAKVKSGRIYEMFQTIQKERGSPSMEYLREFSDDEIKKDLNRFRGMGPKTISCVMLFAMGRPEFPVDTHVLRITKQMGWVGPSTSREEAYVFLNQRVPAKLKLDLHCLLISHGKQCHRCAARGKPQFPPKDGSKLNCPLVSVGKKDKPEIGLVIKKEITIKSE
mmetsp:Transcript_17429/g.25170  ORF Transcript_17429/g.25170 Transcript_17429/m.25170 type:complete len:365 (+) Transcript_17429:84-1178(+)